jgi:hypothetical protein
MPEEVSISKVLSALKVCPVCGTPLVYVDPRLVDDTKKCPDGHSTFSINAIFSDRSIGFTYILEDWETV